MLSYSFLQVLSRFKLAWVYRSQIFFVICLFT